MLPERLKELMIEYRLSCLLQVYDPDQVFRMLGVFCDLFNLDRQTFQAMLVIYLRRQPDHRRVTRALITCSHELGLKGRALTDALMRQDINKQNMYNTRRFPEPIGACWMTDAQRAVGFELYKELHKLGGLL